MVRGLADQSSSESLVRYTFHPMRIVEVLKGHRTDPQDISRGRDYCALRRGNLGLRKCRRLGLLVLPSPTEGGIWLET